MTRKFQVVLVDDEPWGLSGLEEIIPWEEYGFHIAAKCSSSPEALEIIGKLQPDAVFTDIRMPEISGLELIRRAQEQGSQAEFVIVSAYSDFEVARRSLEYGVVSYLLKPFEEEQVRQVTERLAQKLISAAGPAVLEEHEGKVVFSQEQLALLQSFSAENGCMVALLQKEAPDSAFPKGSLALFARAGGLWAYFLTAKPKTQLFPQEGWGLSSTHRGFESPQELYQEARLSLMTGIRYCTHPTICHVQVYLARHLTEPLSIQKLAAIFYLSPLYLSSLYKKQTGEALMHSLNKARLYYAARQLSCTNLSLAEVAQSSGFQDYSYFGRIFKKYMGESPEHYRRSHQQ